MGMTIGQKLIKSHLVSGDMTPGSEVGLRIDQTLTQDATGTMAYLELEAMGIEQVKTELSVAYIDHNTLQTGFENADDHRFIQSVAKKRGIRFSRPGNGICHQVHLERFGVPGKTLIGSDSHTPTGGGIGMLFCFLLRSIYKEISITLAEENPNKSKLLCDHFLIQPYVSDSNNIYDLIVDCSNSITGLRFALDCAQRGNRVCVMSHLYGLDTTFVYEQACKKELRCSFPLRNGERNNLLLADEYLEQYWLKEYDDMLIVYDDVIAAFKEKEENQFCKQIVQSSSLCITEL